MAYDDNSGGGLLGGFGGLGGVGQYLQDTSKNPLFLAGLQMLGNSTPQINKIPNTLEGVPNVLMAASQQQRKAEEEARQRRLDELKIEAMGGAIEATGGSAADAARYKYNPPAYDMIQSYKTNQRQEQQAQQYNNPPPAPQQQAPYQPAPQQQQAPAPQTNAAPAQQPAPDQALQQALATASQKFDSFGVSSMGKSVGDIAAASGNPATAAKFLAAAQAQGLSPESKITPQVLTNPATAMPLGKSLGIGADLSDDQWTQAHAAAVQSARGRGQAEQQAQVQTMEQRGPAQGRYQTMEQRGPAQGQMQPAPYVQTGPTPGLSIPGAATPQQQAPAPQPAPQTVTQQSLAVQEAQRAKTQEDALRRQQYYLTSPNSNAGVKKNAEMQIQHLLKGTEATPDMREYGYYVQQGGSEDFTTWLRGNKRSGAMQNNINTVEGGEAAEHKARVAVDQKAYEKVREQTDNGNKALPAVNTILSIANNVPGGWAGKAGASVAKIYSAIGVDVPKNLSDAELMNSLTRQLIPALRQPGAVSNYEDQIYLDAAPGLSQSKEGRTKIAEMTKRVIERNNEYAKVYRANIGKPDLEDKLLAVAGKPLFTKEEIEEGKALVQPERSNSRPPSARNGLPAGVKSIQVVE